jgi:hypothetical protein
MVVGAPRPCLKISELTNRAAMFRLQLFLNIFYANPKIIFTLMMIRRLCERGTGPGSTALESLQPFFFLGQT